MRRFSSMLLLWGLLVPQVAGQNPPATPAVVEPALVVSLKSADGLLADLKYFANLAGQGDKVGELEAVISAWSSDQGLGAFGIDPKKPILAYAIATPGGSDSPFAVMIPVANEQTLIRHLDGANLKVEKGKDGSYQIDIPNAPVPLYFRIANGYAYVTANDRDHVAPAKLLAAEKLTPADPHRVFGLTLRLDQIPDDLKQLALGQIERRMAELKDESKPGETPEQARGRRAGIDAMNQMIKVVVSDGRALDFNVAVNGASDDVGIGLSIDGKPNTMMSTVIGVMAGSKTKFTPQPDSAFHVGINMSVPLIFKPLISTVIDSAVKDIPARESDPTRREMMMKLVSAVGPTLKAGILDLHVAAGQVGSGGKFSLVAGLGVEKGREIESAVKSLVPMLPERDRDNLKLDVTKVNDVNLHQLRVHDMDANTQRLFGSDASLWAGIAPAALMVGIGADGGEAIKGLAPGALRPTPLIVVEGSMAQLAALAPEKRHADAARKAFADAKPGSDRFRLSLEGGSKLDLKLTLKGTILSYATQTQRQ